MPYDADRRRMAYLTRVIRHGKPKNRPNTFRPIVHGSLNAYTNRGCKCDVCREAKRVYEKEYRHRPRTWPTSAHGRVTTYNCGCRCKLCRRAKADAAASWRARCRPVKAVASPLDKRHAERLAYFRERYQAVKAGTWKTEAAHGA